MATTPSARLSNVRRDEPAADHDPVDELRERASHARRAGGIYEPVEALLDPGSFSGIGTFTSPHPASPSSGEDLPGDGKVGGLGTIGGRPVVVAGDDGDPHAGGGSKVGNERFDRLMRVAVAKGMPLVYLAQSRGLRRPDASGAEGLAEHGAFLPFRTRMRQVPMATAILGDSFEDAGRAVGPG